MDKKRIQDYRDLTVWQVGMEVTTEVYNLTKAFPVDEKYGLTSQLRRAASSIPANIAEGHARDSTKEYLRFLSIAVGSVAEVTTFLELSARLGYVSRVDLSGLLDKIQQERRMLRKLQASLRNRLS